MRQTFKESLHYHEKDRPGKTQIQPTKPTATQADLSLAYSPGVAGPCLAIADNEDDVFKYTNRGNLVAVVSNGTAVLGLGNIGPLASKPVMEGKAVLFKRFADIDVFDIELDTQDPDEIIRMCQLLEPTFGGINLEDIKAPDSFVVEEKLIETMNIPVFHDDQHGTAIIAGAGLINACELVEKNLKDIKVVVNGAGAAGIATAKFLLTLGVSESNLTMCDSKGVIYKGRSNLNRYKEQFALETSARSLSDALKGADVFIGCSVKDAVTETMVKTMAAKPIVFALANPDPEIPYDVAKKARPDAIVATGRTDYPNQVNNVLGFPYIFRGALDVRAKGVSNKMKIAAAHAIAKLAKEPIPESVLQAYQLSSLEFGEDYIIPKPFDPRVVWYVAPAVAEMASKEGLARCPIEDIEEYKEKLKRRFQATYRVMRTITVKAQEEPKTLVFPQGPDSRVLRAARRLVVERIAAPIILGNKEKGIAALEALGMPADGITFVELTNDEAKLEKYTQRLFEIRARKGMTKLDAAKALRNTNMQAALMLECGDADSVLGGLTTYYAKTLRPALKVLPLLPERKTVFAAYIVVIGGRSYILSDCAVNKNPTALELAEIAMGTAQMAREFDIEPHVAMVSYSNFGSSDGEEVEKIRNALKTVQKKEPNLSIDGEMQADTAVEQALLTSRHPFSTLKRRANVLIFPNLTAANASYKLLQRLGRAQVIGPIVSGLSKSVHVAQRDADVNQLVNLAAIAVLNAQRLDKA